MKSKIVVLLLLIGSVQLSAANKHKEILEATKIAWQQRSLLQSMMISYMKNGAGYGTEEDLKVLDYSIAQFEENLDALMLLPKNRKLNEGMKDIQENWYKFRLLVISEPNETDAPILLFRGESLEKLGDVLYENYRKNKAVDASLKELQHFSDMLINSQKLAVYYYASIWGFDAKMEKEGFDIDLDTKFTKSKKNFESSLYDTSWNTDHNAYLDDVNSILTNYYLLPEGKLTELKESKFVLNAFDMLVNKFFRLCKKVSNELLKESLEE
jgi:hypothetical protein